MRKRTSALGILVLLIGCGEVRPPAARRQLPQAAYIEIEPLLAKRCVSCHPAKEPAGGYDLSSYRGILGPGSDNVRNAIAGDGKSMLLLKLSEDVAHWEYLLPKQEELGPGESAEERRLKDFEQLKRWVIANRMAYRKGDLHPPGWSYPKDRNDEDFHGGALRQAGWSLDGCRGCHGEDLGGGESGVACSSCHQGGAFACTTCHGSAQNPVAGAAAPPADLSWNLSTAAVGVGVHQVHLQSRAWWSEVTCKDCHKVPASLRTEGHLDDGDGSTDFKAELVFGSRAALLGVTPDYDSVANSCTVYCHGAAVPSVQAGTGPPVWTAAGSGGCGSCHKVPMAGIGGPNCWFCHRQSVKACTPDASNPACLVTDAANQIGVEFLDPSLHGDGKYPRGKAGQEGTCWGCHGDQAKFGAPAPDLKGSNEITALGVGLHAVHLQSSSQYNAIPCESCHQVPSSIQEPGHIDSDRPAEVIFSALARGSFNPVWDRQSPTCNTTWCHGLDGGSVASWSWTAKLSQPISCDSCHGLPPLQLSDGGSHPSSTDCSSCHAAAYSGAQLDPGKHLNGKVELQ